MLDHHLVTIAENVDVQRHLAINAERLGGRCERSAWARSADWRIQKIENVTFFRGWIDTKRTPIINIGVTQMW